MQNLFSTILLIDYLFLRCALLELWNDGTPALDLPGLLAYRNGEDRPPTMTLPDTCEEELRTLLESMTERNPKDRRSAEIYLDEARGKYVESVVCWIP